MPLWFLRLSWPWKTQQSIHSDRGRLAYRRPNRVENIYNPHDTIHDKLLDFIMHALFRSAAAAAAENPTSGDGNGSDDDNRSRVTCMHALPQPSLPNRHNVTMPLWFHRLS